MKSRIALLSKLGSRRIRAQAAYWLTELEVSGHDPEVAARVQRWIERSPRHAAALALAAKSWHGSRDLPATWSYIDSGVDTRPHPWPSRLAAVGVAMAIAAVAITLYALRDPTLATRAGEQKTTALSDGTLVSLNANSRVVIQYDEHVRKVTLTRGEVLFNVSKHQPRPFVVVIGERKVVAMGTSFMVRRESPTGLAYAVTLVEGRIAVEPIAAPDILPSDFTTGLKLLSPGQRLRFTDGAPETMGSPSIDRVTAWRRGQLIFDDTSLAEAAAEFNRYDSAKLLLDNPRIAALRVGGVFRINDPASFARAMASTYHLGMVSRGKTITLVDAQDDSR